MDLADVLDASEMTAAALGTAQWDFSAWLASYTANTETTLLSIEWFDAAKAGGASLGSQTLADGSSSNGVTQSIGGSSAPSAGTPWTNKNWSEYITSGMVPAGAISFRLSYIGQGGKRCLRRAH